MCLLYLSFKITAIFNGAMVLVWRVISGHVKIYGKDVGGFYEKQL